MARYYFPTHDDWTTIGPLTSRSVIGRHYSVVCTEIEARAEVLSLARKKDKDSLDDADEHLVASLEVAYGKPLSGIARAAYRGWKCAQDCNIKAPA